MKISFVFGNHNTPNAIEDYVYFISEILRSFNAEYFISKFINQNSDLLVIQEDFSLREANDVLEFKKSNTSKKVVLIATENIQGDSFNDILQITKILENRDQIKDLAIEQIKSNSFPKYLYNKYLNRFRRDLTGFTNVLNRIQRDHLAKLKRRYENFLKVAGIADQIWLMPGLERLPYEKLLGDKLKSFPFIICFSGRRYPNAINYKAMLTGKITGYRRGLANFLGLEESRKFLEKKAWDNCFTTSTFDTPLLIRREMLNSVGIYLDLPVSAGSNIFSSMKAAVALEAGVPFFSLTGADPGRFGPFVRTFPDIRSLKEELEKYSREELVEMGAQCSSEASKVFTPAAYPFLEELLK